MDFTLVYTSVLNNHGGDWKKRADKMDKGRSSMRHLSFEPPQSNHHHCASRAEPDFAGIENSDR
jgi:hypothetical protein